MGTMYGLAADSIADKFRSSPSSANLIVAKVSEIYGIADVAYGSLEMSAPGRDFNTNAALIENTVVEPVEGTMQSAAACTVMPRGASLSTGPDVQHVANGEDARIQIERINVAEEANIRAGAEAEAKHAEEQKLKDKDEARIKAEKDNA